MPQIEGEESVLAELDSWLMQLPNLLDDAVPAGDDEDDNELVRTHGTIPTFSFIPRDHVEIGEGLGQMDLPLAPRYRSSPFCSISFPTGARAGRIHA